ACSTAFRIDCTVLSISTMAPFFIPFDFAEPTPIMFKESFKTSPIITLIFDVPISRLTNTSLFSKERHLLIQNIISLLFCFSIMISLFYYNLLFYMSFQKKDIYFMHLVNIFNNFLY